MSEEQPEIKNNANTDTENKDYISLSKINNDLYGIFTNKNYIINYYLQTIKNLNTSFIIDIKDAQLINFIIIALLKTKKYKDIKQLLTILKNNENHFFTKKSNNYIKYKKKIKFLNDKIKMLIPKFFHICIINAFKLSKLLKYSSHLDFCEDVFKLMKMLFLNNVISKENVINILRVKIISSLFINIYDDNIEINELLDINNKNILDIKPLEAVINFLLSFKFYKMSKRKTLEFTYIVSSTINIMNELLFGNNHNNIFRMTCNDTFMKLLDLCQISLDCIGPVTQLLIKIYKFRFKTDYCLQDLSDQFILKNYENIYNKNSNLIAKNHFMYELFKYENLFAKEEDDYIINNGFMFNNVKNNGILLINSIENKNESTFPNESFSLVISFRLMSDNNKKGIKYNIFSFYKTDSNVFSIFIEENKLKLNTGGKSIELFKDVKNQKNYVLWLFHSGASKKSSSIFYLNKQKFIKNSLIFPKEYCDISIGYEKDVKKNNTNVNNFIGIIGTFILFNSCYINEENNNTNNFYEKNLINLKCNYESLIYISHKIEISPLSKEIQSILNKLSCSIETNIEIIISTKSILNSENKNYMKVYEKGDNFAEINDSENLIYYKAFYYSDKKNQKMLFAIKIDDYSKKLITYPLEFNISYDDFLNKNGIKYLELELYYFIGMISSLSNSNNNEKNKIILKYKTSEIKEDEKENEDSEYSKSRKQSELTKSDLTDEKEEDFNYKLLFCSQDKNDIYLKIQYIFNQFLYCLQLVDKKQEKKYANDIENFFTTLNNLINVNSKNKIKIDILFLTLVISYMNFLIDKNKFFEYCSFIFSYENYEPNDDKIFELLFQTIKIYIVEFKENFFNKNVFEKILSFEQIYLVDNISKDTKKIYSILIQKCISLSFSDHKEDCFVLYFDRLRDFLYEDEKNNIDTIKKVMSWTDITEADVSEENENIFSNLKKGKAGFKKMFYDYKVGNKNLKGEECDEKEKNEANNFKLMYKYLKNLYLALDKDKIVYESFINYCNENEENIIEFFNEEFKFVSENTEINTSANNENEENDNSSNNNNNNNSNVINSKEKAEKTKYAELIKALCVRFIDEITFESSLRNASNEIKEQKHLKNIHDTSRLSLRGNIMKSTSSYNLSMFNANNSRIENEQNLRNTIYNFNRNNLQHNNIGLYMEMTPAERIDSILVQRFEFFSTFVVTPYTFNSFFLILFRNLSQKEKLSYIKEINAEKKTKNFLFSEKNYPKVRLYIRIILQLIERISYEDTTIPLMNKLEFLGYVYNIFNDLLFNMVDYYQEKKKLGKEKEKEIKPIINSLLCSKENGFYFYKIFFNALKTQNGSGGIVYVKDSQIVSPSDTEKNDKGIEELLKKVKQNITLMIKKTLFEIIDPFYFKLLFDLYTKQTNDDNLYRNYVLDTINYIIELFDKFDLENANNNILNIAFEMNNKNLLILIYKMVFFVSKRDYLFNNMIFNKRVILYLSAFSSKTNLLYLKILFAVEDINSEKIESHYHINKKLIIELLFEIFFDLYIEAKKSNKNCEKDMYEELINELLLVKYIPGLQNNKIILSLSKSYNELDETLNKNGEQEGKSKKKRKEKKIIHSLCYMIDRISIIQEKMKELADISCVKNQQILDINSLKNYVMKKYEKENYKNENDFSVTVLFLIKLILHIKKLKELDKQSSLLEILIKISEKLCKDAEKLQKKYATYNPLMSKNEENTELYEEFRLFITKEYMVNKKFNKEDLIQKTLKFSDTNKYLCFYYKQDYKSNIKSSESHIQIITNNDDDNIDRNKSWHMLRKLSDASNQSKNNSFSTTSNNELSGRNISGSSGNLAEFMRNINSIRARKRNSISTLNLIGSAEKRIANLSQRVNFRRSEKLQFINYKIIPKLQKCYVRNYFSIYFMKLLTYDEDFIKLKKIYYYLYNKEIPGLEDDYFLNYPSKLKNRLSTIYVKNFLKKDLNFFTSKYFQYSHSFIKKTNFQPKNKLLFPTKEILREFEYIHKTFLFDKEDPHILFRNCELITYDGAVYGDIFLFQNCLVFKSDLENDKRKVKDSLDCACCSMEFDFLEEEKLKVIEFEEIKEVINRKFLYSWMSMELFMNDGYSYLFNFFNEDTNNLIMDLFKNKNKNIKIIRNVKEYFDKENYVKKWGEGTLSTYDYLLILNKFSSRTYNDINQYPVMPWIFKSDFTTRNFDIPMSIQEEDAQKLFMKMPYDTYNKENRWHSNHYSTSAYICYYLMRTNPYTNSMIKFQSNNFDAPDRQFATIYQTLTLCEKNNNNREPIPELYTIPEVYLNLNDNNFGKRTESLDNMRVHNVSFNPYANNCYEFTYKFRSLLDSGEDINSKINEWIDFVFGVNQFNKDNTKGNGFRNFNKHCYGQNINIKKMVQQLKNKSKSDRKIYEAIKLCQGMIISFGQCPFQILTSEQIKKKKEVNENLQSINNEVIMNDSINYKQIDDNSIIISKKNDTNNNIIYFKKSLFNTYLYCFLNNKEIEIYQKENRFSTEFKLKKKISTNKNYLLFQKNKNGYPIINPKFVFCELKEEYYIFCRYLDNSIKFFLPSIEFQYLLESFVTTIIRIDEKEFLIGDIDGYIYHYKINLSDTLNLKLKLIKKIKSNKKSITSMFYNNRLNIVVITDIDSLVIRDFYNFEFLTYIDNVLDSDKEIIVDVKMSTYDYLYVLINKNYDELFEIKGYSLNGICFGNYQGRFTNYDISNGGKIIVSMLDMGLINILDATNFNLIYSRFIAEDIDGCQCETKTGETEKDDEICGCVYFHFCYERPNIIYYGIKNENNTKIKFIKLRSDELKYFW